MFSTPHRLLNKHTSGQSTDADQHHLRVRELPPSRARTAPEPRNAPHLQEHDVKQRVRRPAAQPAAALARDTQGELAEATGPSSEIHLGTSGGCARSAVGRRPGHVPTASPPCQRQTQL